MHILRWEESLQKGIVFPVWCKKTPCGEFHALENKVQQRYFITQGMYGLIGELCTIAQE